MAIGEIAKQTGKRYRVRLDRKLGVWRILDSWHPKITGLDLADDVDDDNEALTVIPNEAIMEILSEMERLGIVQSQLPSQPTSVPQSVTKLSSSAPDKLKVAEMGINAIIKIVGISDIGVINGE